MRVVLAQLAPVPGASAANLATATDLVGAHPDADLAVFPELFVSGYRLARARDDALATGDAAFAPLREVAREAGVAVLIGFAERQGDGMANAVACIDRDGTWAATYRKTHVFGAAERAAFAPGQALRVVPLAGVEVGPLVCFDMEFPEPARALAQAGARLLVTVAANMAPYGADHALAARARALDNRRPHVYVNRVGDEDGQRFVGGSLVCGADGQVRHASGTGAGVAVVDVELATGVDPDVDYLRFVRHGLPVR
jgi:predicted amidohydrolase